MPMYLEQYFEKHLSLVRLSGILIILAAISFSIIHGLDLSARYGGTDLRCRVIGARNLLAGNSPYFSHWSQQQSAYFLDPNDDPARIANGNVSTPAVLLTFSNLYSMPYGQVRFFWTILQYVLLATIFVVLWTMQVTVTRRYLLIPVLFLLFSCNQIWFFNIERGQIYSLYAFFLAAFYGCMVSRHKKINMAGGFLLAVFCFYRPFAVVFLLTMFQHNGKTMLAGFGTGLLICLLVFIPGRADQWMEYFSAMNIYQQEYLRQWLPTSYSADQVPQIIENTSNLRSYSAFPTNNVKGILDHFYRKATNSSLNLLPVFLILLPLILLAAVYKKIRSPKQLFILSCLIYSIAEICMNVPRADYNLVQYIFPVSLILLEAPRRSRLPLIFCVLSAPLIVYSQNGYSYILFESATLLLFIYQLFVAPLDADTGIRKEKATTIMAAL